MAKTIWKGSILDTYNGNNGFGTLAGGTEVKSVQTAKGVDFLQQPYEGVESVDGFRTNIPPKGDRTTDFKMVDMKTDSIQAKFEKLDTNTGFKWFDENNISPFNKNKSYSKSVDLKK